MIKRLPTHCGDDTCPSCVVAGELIYLAHHAGGFDKPDIRHQMRAAFEGAKSSLESAGAALSDMVQIHLYLKNLDDFDAAREVFYEYFEKDNCPARMTSRTDFLDDECLCMIDGVAYKPVKESGCDGMQVLTAKKQNTEE
jgi:2-iminobutanoate/2-iminopropanoate deaminase